MGAFTGKFNQGIYWYCFPVAEYLDHKQYLRQLGDANDSMALTAKTKSLSDTVLSYYIV